MCVGSVWSMSHLFCVKCKLSKTGLISLLDQLVCVVRSTVDQPLYRADVPV